VATSRAETHLFISNSKNYGSPSKPSRFLDLIKENLPQPRILESIIPKEEIDLQKILTETDAQESRYAYSFSEINNYRNCPRRYFYEYVLNLRGNSEEIAFVQFHGAVREVISWAKNKSILGEEISAKNAHEKLHEIWEEKSIKSHSYNQIYLDEAETLINKAVGCISSQTNKTAELKDLRNNPLEFSIAGKSVRIYPDFLEIDSQNNSIRIQKIKTGKTKLEERQLSEDEKFNIAALFQAAQENYPDSEILASFEYIATGENFTYNPKNIKTQLKHLEKAVDGIASSDFEPNINPQKCPRCPHYFICPGGDLS
jgi:RecB family exonuclease